MVNLGWLFMAKFYFVEGVRTCHLMKLIWFYQKKNLMLLEPVLSGTMEQIKSQVERNIVRIHIRLGFYMERFLEAPMRMQEFYL